MKKIIFILSLFLTASTTFAQVSLSKNKKGFYLNPNFNHTSYKNSFTNNGGSHKPNILFKPNLTVGYMWGNKNRHNISLTSLDGDMIYHYKNISSELRYSYDILTLRKNKFSFYISPYLRANMNYSYSDYKSSNFDYKYDNLYASISLGVAPVFEYKVSKRIDFVASLPFEIIKQSHLKGSFNNNSTTQNYHFDYRNFANQAEAKIGIRLNLFRK